MLRRRFWTVLLLIEHNFSSFRSLRILLAGFQAISLTDVVFLHTSRKYPMTFLDALPGI